MVMPKLIALTALALAHHVLAQVALPWRQVCAVLPSVPMNSRLIERINNGSVEELVSQVPQYVPAGKVSFLSAFVLEAGSDTGHLIQLALFSTTSQLPSFVL